MSLEEARKVRDLGEAGYMRQARNEALEWIGNHPAEFLRLTLLRVVHFWCGPLRLSWTAAAITAVTILALLGLRRALPALTFPLRSPLEGMLLLLAGAEVWHWIRRKDMEV